MTLDIAIADEAEMASLGAAIGAVLDKGDRIALVGDLGAGKTTLARSILRTVAGDPVLEVPSPTFTIVQHYEGRVPVRHVDLYRIADEAEAAELGLGDGDAAELVEWPRAPLPITVSIDFGPTEEARAVHIEAPADWLARLERQRARRRFLAAAGWGDAQAVPLKQDASTRNYDRLVRGGETAVLMDAPSYAQEAGSYAARARLAHGNNHAFLSIGALLHGCGLSAPAVFAAEPETGFIVLEDLGDEKIAQGGEAIAERYLLAAEVLAAFHERPLPESLPGGYVPPRFDATLGVFEVGLFPEWVLREPPSEAYRALWREALDTLWRGDDHLALRDFHSPNCLWLPGREGIAKIGVIDYQDAMIAPSAFDVVSLAQDARVPVPDSLAEEIVSRYLAGRSTLDEARWREAYAIIGAQRAARIAGVFRRLNDRDGKPQYLKHLPHVMRALADNLAATPALGKLRAWFAQHVEIAA